MGNAMWEVIYKKQEHGQVQDAGDNYTGDS